MASSSLYSLARSHPKIIEEIVPVKSFRQELLEDLKEKFDAQKFYDFQEQVKEFFSEAGAKAYQFLLEAGESLQDHYDKGLDAIPTDVLITAIACTIMAMLLTVSIIRRIYERAQHKKLYGDNAFPPLVPGGVRKTAAALAGSNLPGYFKQCADAAGPIFRLKHSFFQGPMVVAVGDVELAKEILEDRKTKKPEESYASIATIAGGPNIMTSEGPLWKVSRKGVAPAFLKEYLDRMHQVSEHQTEQWIQQTLHPLVEKNETFDLGNEMVLLTLSIICESAFDYKIKDKEAKYLVEEFSIVTKEFGSYDIVKSSSKGSERGNLARQRVQAVAKKIIKSYQRKDSGAKLYNTIINRIVKNKHYENDEHRAADIIMFLFAGLDQTAYSLAWTLFELAKHPEVLTSLRQALNGKGDPALVHDMLKDVLREGMRLHPVVPGAGVRTAGRDFYVKDSAMVIPKGSQVIFPSMVLTRNNVKDAEVFKPSRWRENPENTFLHFSAGRRNCVGQSMAIAEITWALSRLCAEFKFEIVDEGRAEFCGTLKCVGTLLKARRMSQASVAN
jgi:cytochrome P450